VSYPIKDTRSLGQAIEKLILPAKAWTLCERKEKKELRGLVEQLKRMSIERGYTQRQIASALGVSLTSLIRWWTGYTVTARRESIERLREFLSDDPLRQPCASPEGYDR
jgi:DNA invertase Pin-like site-specific DNA recombinase